MQSIEDVSYRLIHDPSFDHWLQPHHRSVERTSLILADRLGIATGRIGIAARCHDVGKLAISQDIWTKPGPLTPVEKRIVSLHSEIGEQMVAAYFKREIPRIVRHHQEWYDGNGYPDKLARSAIPVESRIIAVADALDSLASDRPYRKGTSVINALIEIWRCSGTQFDPAVVRALEEAIQKDLLGEQIDLHANRTA